MDFSFFAQGALFGFAIAAPVGPIGVLCFQRTLSGGWAAGVLTGLGAASADAFYGGLAGFGVAGLTTLLIEQRAWIQMTGGLFLFFLGLRLLFSRFEPHRGSAMRTRGAAGYGTAFILTLTNPMTVLSFAAAFAAMGLGQEGTDSLAAGALVAGVFTGSMTWWLFLASVSHLLRYRLSGIWLGWVNRAAGVVLMACGWFLVFGHPGC